MRLAWAVLAAFALLGFFVFPGHTYLQSDTQIYLPMLERVADPAVLTKDIIATHPHLRYTVYDEVAVALKRASGADFEGILGLLQLAARLAGLYGVFLLGTAAGLEFSGALFLAGLCGLGALIAGPEVLTVEYEPVPRGLALPFLLLGLGWCGHGRWRAAGVALGIALLLHPPTVWPVWLVAGGYALWRRHYGMVWGLAGGVSLLALAAKGQVGESEAQAFWATIPPDLEALQRMRAAYVWVGMWKPERWLQHAVLLALAVGAWWRIRAGLNPALRALLLALPLVGVVSVGLSYLLLDVARWIVIPQVQPARALLWVTVAAILNGALAAARAERWTERLAWLVAPFWLPGAGLWWLAAPAAVLVRTRWAWVIIPVALWAYPTVGGVRNYPNLHTAELTGLSTWARAQTPPDAVFHFPDAGLALYPGIFRARSLRNVWVDRKGGGQVNFTYGLAKEWWRRYDATIGRAYTPRPLAEYRALGADFLILQRAHGRSDAEPVFANAAYAVYALP
ncbi:MAG: hypothetical protein ACK6D7_15505 [Acidobacteriota bacterium]